MARIVDLECAAAPGNFRHDPNYMRRSESDRMTEAMRRSLLDEVERQRRARAESYTSELTVNVRHFNSDWERQLDEAWKDWAKERARLLGELQGAQATQRWETRIEALYAVIRDWGLRGRRRPVGR